MANRILFVAQVLPWPPDDGTKLRTGKLLEVLTEFGEVDVFALDSREPPSSGPANLRRVGTAPRPPYGLRGGRLLRWVAGTLPSEFAGRDYSQARSALRRFSDPPYDLVWFNRLETFVNLDVVEGQRKVLDLDVLEEERTATRLEKTNPAMATRLRLAVDLRRWRRLERSVTSRVDAALVCSDEDRRSLGTGNVRVVPNGYPEVTPCGRVVAGDPPTIGMVASFAYGPNLDAARYLVRHVFPLVRSQLPGAHLRLIGSHGDRTLADLAGHPGVAITGYVADLVEELSRLDVIAVPLRWGGGTRVKLLEAFAHRIPVVATPFAARGLEAVPGKHFLAADDAPGFARSLVELLVETDTRRRLTQEAHELFVAKYRWSVIRRQVKGLIEELLGG